MASTSELKQAVVHTLAYFDLCHYPLTISELWRYLFLPTSTDQPALSPTMAAVAAAAVQPLVQSHDGFLTLTGQPIEKYIIRRQENFARSEQYWRRLRTLGRLLALLPGVRLLCVSNTLSYDNVGPSSDIDILAVTAPGRIWLTRGILISMLSLLRLRPGQAAAHRSVCVSFFIDTDHLQLEPTALPRNDIHFAYWIEQLVPYYDAGGWFAQFTAANSWVLRMLPNALQTIPHPRRSVRLTTLERLTKRVGEWATSAPGLERLAEKYSRRRFPAIITQKMNRDSGVIIRPGIIKLITNDRREGYRNEWIVKTAALRRS